MFTVHGKIIFVFRRAEITFSQSDMPYFRKRMIWE